MLCDKTRRARSGSSAKRYVWIYSHQLETATAAETAEETGPSDRVRALAAQKVQEEVKRRNAVGSMIGKKRKERKRKHGAA